MSRLSRISMDLRQYGDALLPAAIFVLGFLGAG